METNKIIEGDCIEEMKKMLDNSVDAIVTDPPYSISNEVIITRGRNKMKFKGKDISHNFGEWDKFKSKEDFWKFTYSWLDECSRILKEGRIIVIFFDRDKINFISKYLQEKGFKCKGYFAYIKSNPVPQARKVKWMNGWEMAGLWQKPNGKLVYNYQLGQHKDYVIHSICSGKERTKHPTQKPLAVIKPFIEYWTNERETILDPFAGSGTTGVACLQTGRNFILIEKELEYIEIIKARLKPFLEQNKLNLEVNHNQGESL
jgi:DNA modification methylase